jgi:hypothetical protein
VAAIEGLNAVIFIYWWLKEKRKKEERKNVVGEVEMRVAGFI